MIVTREHVKEQLGRLAEIHAMPRGWKLDQALSRFHWVMTQEPAVHDVQLEAAVGEYLKSDEEYFPKPGRLRQLALRQSRPSSMGTSLRDYLDWEFGGQDGATWGRRDVPGEDGRGVATYTPCPACNVSPAWQNGRLKVRHVAARHHGSRMPVIGWSDEAETFYRAPAARIAEPA